MISDTVIVVIIDKYSELKLFGVKIEMCTDFGLPTQLEPS